MRAFCTLAQMGFVLGHGCEIRRPVDESKRLRKFSSGGANRTFNYRDHSHHGKPEIPFSI
jgi:hypothetical protein